MAETIPSLFLAAAERNNDRIAFNYFAGSWSSMSYGEVRSLVQYIDDLLGGCGARRGDRIALVAENRPEWCATYLAIVQRGAVAVPIDMQLGAGEIGTLITAAEATIIVYSARTAANVAAALEGREGLDLDEVAASRSAAGEGDPAAAQPPSLSATASLSPDDISSIIYTSGTTGTPKGVVLTHRNFCSDAEAVIAARVVTHEDTVLSILPLHHTYPFMCTFLVPLFLGAAVTFGPGLKSAELIGAIRDTRVTVVVGVPRLYEMIRNGITAKMKEKGALAGALFRMMRLCGAVRKATGLNIGRIVFGSVHASFPAVRFFASGGARLDPAVMRDLEALGFTVLEGYGLTETAPVVTFTPPERRKPGSVGRPLPGAEIALSDAGEVMVRGPMVMKGYYRNPVATAEVMKDGWFLTGDMGALDNEGYLFITGRKKEVIVLSSGKNIYPEDVEKAYMTTPLIKEMCVVPAPSGLAGSAAADSIHAVIVPDVEYAKKASIGNITEALNDAITAVSLKLPEYMRIRGFTLVSDPLPRTPLGKLRRFMVQEMLAKRERTAGRPEMQPGILTESSLLRDATGRTVVEGIRTVMGEEVPLRAADNLELDLGFDSLKKIEFVSFLESAFSIDLPDTFLAGVQTVGEIVAAVKTYREDEGAAGGAAVAWKDILGREPSPAEAERIGYAQGPLALGITFGLFMLQKSFFKLFFRLRVEGADRIPEAGAFVITPNHTSYLDGFIIAAAVPFRTFRRLYFLGLQEYFTGTLTSWFGRLAHVIPIDSEVYLTKALQLSAYVIRRRQSLCIFPEGTRSSTTEVLPFKKGIGILALEMGAPVVPAAIEGAHKALPRGAAFIRPSRLRVVFGAPLLPSTAEAAGAETAGPQADRYQAFADTVRENVIMLLQK